MFALLELLLVSLIFASPLKLDYLTESNWGADICKNGLSQSPIDFPDKSECIKGNDYIKIESIQYTPIKNEAVQFVDEHKFIVNAANNGFIKIKKDNIEYKYNLNNIHFHLGSEHSIKGETFDIETHLVHVLENEKDDPTGKNKYLVIALIFDVDSSNRGDDRSKFIDNFHFDTREKIKEIKLNDFNKVIKTNSYYYEGSLTTPGCDESVNWLVVNHIFAISPETYSKFRSLLAKYYPEGNFRKIQNLNQRNIYYINDELSTEEEEPEQETKTIQIDTQEEKIEDPTATDLRKSKKEKKEKTEEIEKKEEIPSEKEPEPELGDIAETDGETEIKKEQEPAQEKTPDQETEQPAEPAEKNNEEPEEPETVALSKKKEKKHHAHKKEEKKKETHEKKEVTEEKKETQGEVKGKIPESTEEEEAKKEKEIAQEVVDQKQTVEQTSDESTKEKNEEVTEEKNQENTEQPEEAETVALSKKKDKKHHNTKKEENKKENHEKKKEPEPKKVEEEKKEEGEKTEKTTEQEPKQEQPTVEQTPEPTSEQPAEEAKADSTVYVQIKDPIENKEEAEKSSFWKLFFLVMFICFIIYYFRTEDKTNIQENNGINSYLLMEEKEKLV